MAKRYAHKCGMIAAMRDMPSFGDCINVARYEVIVASFDKGPHSVLRCEETHYACGWHLARYARMLRYGCLGHGHGMPTSSTLVEVVVLDPVDIPNEGV